MPVRKTVEETGLAVVSPMSPAMRELVKKLGERPQASETARGYAADWRSFVAFTKSQRLQALPAQEETIVAYLAALAGGGKKHSTIARHYATIRSKHREAGRPLPTLEAVRNALANIGRTIGTAPQGKAPLMADVLKRVVGMLDDSITGVRDRALLLVGFAAAMRRSELVALNVSDVQFTDDGLVVTVRRSKTDQVGKGRKIGIPHGSIHACPVRSLRAWIAQGGITEGALFRRVRKGVVEKRLPAGEVAVIVKRTVELAGLDPKEFAGHSLRSGLATSAAKAGKGLDVIMATTGHKSERVAMGYIKHGSLFDKPASEGLL
jgi:integrase